MGNPFPAILIFFLNNQVASRVPKVKCRSSNFLCIDKDAVTTQTRANVDHYPNLRRVIALDKTISRQCPAFHTYFDGLYAVTLEDSFYTVIAHTLKINSLLKLIEAIWNLWWDLANDRAHRTQITLQLNRSFWGVPVQCGC
ncbi:hypothetical protein [Oculatella sp. LEGE 06141]|uniref:hypothetical protein n=1 Tax=Oculatella sp. LEGE 06141 TaxID=1828648 RepID=UPI001D13E354|nr:hypothetical protein [Oculatella sp. LEGE 06141]